MKTEYVYVMSNESYWDKLKIGLTADHPSKRKEQLYSTGVPTPFTVEGWLELPEDKAAYVESKIHGVFDSHRQNQSREFFSTKSAILADDHRTKEEYIADREELLEQVFHLFELLADANPAYKVQRRESTKQLDSKRNTPRKHPTLEERGIGAGEFLVFRHDTNVIVEVCPQNGGRRNFVNSNGAMIMLSDATREHCGRLGVRWTNYWDQWMYDGTLLCNIDQQDDETNAH